MTSNNQIVTDADIRTYQEDGIICLRNVFDRDQVERLREAAEECMAQPSELHAELADLREEKGRFFHDTFVWQRNDYCRSFLFDSVAAQITRQLMRSQKVNLFFDQWLIKEPGTITRTPWHNDQPYWPIKGNQVCTLWLALDDVTRENGAVEYVKGSHLPGQRFRPASFSGSNQYTEDLPEVPDIDAIYDQLDMVHFDMEPGDCTIHHGLTIHGALQNTTNDKRRRAYVIRWTGDDVVFDPRPGIQEMPPLPDIAAGGPIDSELWPRIH